MEVRTCPLSLCLLRMVFCAAHLGTCTKKLARALGLSEESVNTYWKRIKKALNIEERHQAVEVARQNGWFEMLPVEMRGA